MDQLKKNLFWIILAVVVLGGVGLWYSQMPDVDTARSNALSTADLVSKAANSSNTPGAIKNATYVSAAASYLKELDAQKGALFKKWDAKQIDVKFADVPGKDKPSIEFDNYISKLRESFAAKLKAAGVQAPANFDALTFAGSGVDDRSAEITRHRDYRLRYMAVLEEVVEALSAKPGSVNISTYETNPEVAEGVKTETAGPIALLKFTFHLPEETAKLSALNYDKALAFANRKREGAMRDNAFKGPDAPLDVSSIDLEFLSHISAVPPVLRKLESSSRYFGVISKADFERSAPAFPNTKDVRDTKDPLYKAVYIPTLNTHFGEGPVRVLVSMDILEFNKKKAEEFDKGPIKAVKPNTPTAPTTPH